MSPVRLNCVLKLEFDMREIPVRKDHVPVYRYFSYRYIGMKFTGRPDLRSRPARRRPWRRRPRQAARRSPFIGPVLIKSAGIFFNHRVGDARSLQISEKSLTTTKIGECADGNRGRISERSSCECSARSAIWPDGDSIPAQRARGSTWVPSGAIGS